ncbi:UspA domain-containing protein [Arcobacter venerupis]|uniref:UspA domain-containing protein n=1 Tax=Arcobacter venerupis TaxID=1054033 RepID=A0AAE7E332_9BACT|nr:universal stress protein [Arcobacter venerupis]QKF66818.1 UspA domain-containing protein [Arcobacter venerupis]RWS49814.1 hypothetical protein CKA56_06925 [Arcobacter venerupis]
MTKNKILFATDFSQKSFKIIENILNYIQHSENELYIIHVIENKLLQEKVNKDITKNKGFKILKKYFPILEEKQFFCVEGNVEEQVAYHVDKLSISLVILGYSKKNDFISRFFESSNTKDIVRNLNTLSLIMKSKKNICFNNILIPTDLSVESKEYITEVSKLFPDAKIKIYYSYLLPIERRLNFYSFEQEETSDFQKEAKENLLKEAYDFYNSLEIKNNKRFIIRETALSVENFIKDTKDIKTDLIAVHTTGFFSFFAFYLVEHSKINILIKKIN